MYIKQPSSVASCQIVFFYIFLLVPGQITTITIAYCLGYLYQSITLKPQPNEFPFTTDFKGCELKKRRVYFVQVRTSAKIICLGLFWGYYV